jgi:hypothetical protein
MMTTLLAKRLATFLLCCAAANPVFGQGKPNRAQEGFLGSVRSVRTEVVEISYESGRAVAKKRRINSIEQFDRPGRTVTETVFTDSGSVQSVLFSDQNAYDSDGRLSETFTKHNEFTYLPERKTYTYDRNGNVVEEDGFDASGKIGWKHEYLYDEQNRKIQETSLNFRSVEDPRPHRWTFAYDEKGRLKTEDAFIDGGVGLKPTDDLGGPFRRAYVYENSMYPTLRLSVKADGRLGGYSSHKYDSRGNEIEDIEYSADGSMESRTKYTYAFDKRGNWIRQYTFELTRGNSSYRLTERRYQIIEYF